MNTRTLSILLFAVLLAAGAFYFTFMTPREREESSPSPSSSPFASPTVQIFEEAGNIISGNPGLKEGVWYLVSEEPGAPGITRELIFPENMACQGDGEFLICQKMTFEAGDRVHIRGSRNNTIVEVSGISFAPEVQTATVNLYYYNAEKDQHAAGNVLCSRQGLVPVQRAISVREDMHTKAVRLLLEGALWEEERNAGIKTEYPLEGLQLTNSMLENGILTLAFEDPNAKTSGGACRAGILWFQIEQTAKQFPGVNQVRFLPEELFQP